MRGPIPRNLEERAEGLPLGRGEKAVEKHGVFAHDEVRVERHVVSFGGKVAEGRHRHVDFIAESGRLHQNLGRRLFQQFSVNASDHLESFFVRVCAKFVQDARAPRTKRPRRAVANEREEPPERSSARRGSR